MSSHAHKRNNAIASIEVLYTLGARFFYIEQREKMITELSYI